MSDKVHIKGHSASKQHFTEIAVSFLKQCNERVDARTDGKSELADRRKDARVMNVDHDPRVEAPPPHVLILLDVQNPLQARSQS